MAELSLENSEVVYQVFRALKQPQVESYGKSIERYTGLSQGQVGDALRKLLEKDIIKKGKRTQSQYYKINYEGLADFTNEQLELENTKDMAELLKHYTKFYTNTKEISTIQKMLVEDFQEGLFSYKMRRKEKIPEKFEDLVSEVLSEYDASMRPEEHIANAFESLSNQH